MGNSSPKTPATLLLLFFILVIVCPPLSFSLSFSNYNTLLSLSHSLTTRVANLRDSREDCDGAARARAIAQKVEAFQGLGLWRLAWTMGCDYRRNYAWTDISAISFTMLASAVSDVKELLRALNELVGIDSDSERVAWVSCNYQNILSVSRSLLGKLLKVLRQSDALREIVETLQKEVVEGDLLRDCLEVSIDDLKGLVQVFKDMALQYVSSSSGWTELRSS